MTSGVTSKDGELSAEHFELSAEHFELTAERRDVSREDAVARLQRRGAAPG